MKFSPIVAAVLASSVVAVGAHAETSSRSGTATRTAAAATGHDAKPADRGGGAPHWAYEGETGPDRWGSLSPDYHLCREGASQSPIDLADPDGAVVHEIDFDYGLTPLRILHNGHTVQLNYEPGSGIEVNGDRFELLQLHFHTPSEHSVAGRRAAMEAHLVHKSESGELAVVGILIEAGDENLALQEMWNEMPREEGPERAQPRILLNARDLLPRGQGYYRYMGSLTTPPCSEGVNWYVMAEPVEASPAQIAAFAEAVGENARPIQPINDRMALGPR
ncbi:MAG: carbonic anhydrase [Inquilinaceae bacterium]